MCDEINRRVGSIVLDVEIKRPNKRELCRLITRWSKTKNYGFRLMVSYIGGDLEFFTCNSHVTGYYSVYNYNRRHRKLIKTHIDFKKIKDKEIQEWFMYVYNHFADQYEPTILKKQKNWRLIKLKMKVLNYIESIISKFYKFR